VLGCIRFFAKGQAMSLKVITLLKFCISISLFQHSPTPLSYSKRISSVLLQLTYRSRLAIKRGLFIARLGAFISTLLMSSLLVAGSQTGTVDYIIVRASDGLIYFTLKDAAATNRPSCATINYWMIGDENSNSGQAQYAMVLSAQASGKSVTVEGMGFCKRWPDGEDVNAIMIKN